MIDPVKGNCTLNQNSNWACFVYYLKIMNTVMKNIMSILKQIVWETKKNGNKISVGQMVLELLIKAIFC